MRVRKRRQKSSRRKSSRVVWALVLFCASVASGWMYLKVKPVLSEWATLEQITILGTDRVQRKEVLALLQLPPDVSLFSLEPDRLVERVEHHPWIAAASVQRVFPDTLAIAITEREAVAVLQSPRGAHLLDEEGYLLSAVSDKQFPSLPRVKGLTPKAFRQKGELIREQARKGIQVAGLLFRELQTVPTVEVVHQSTIVADVPGVRFHFGSSFEDQWQRFRALYPSIQDRMNSVPQEIDLRYPGKVILRERK